METKVNLGMALALAVAWGALTLTDADPAIAPATPETSALAELEDAAALDRRDPALARALADRYLALEEPRLAVVAIMAADPAVREDPALLHRLAQAYERTGRMEDALATARLAVARCARALGSGATATPVPRHACTEGTHAALDVHQQALGHMVRWGVHDVVGDRRAGRAYALATRNATIVSAGR